MPRAFQEKVMPRLPGYGQIEAAKKAKTTGAQRQQRFSQKHPAVSSGTQGKLGEGNVTRPQLRVSRLLGE